MRFAPTTNPAPPTPQVVGIMRALQRAVPPFKWLLVLPQLTSRVCHPQPDVAELITALLVGAG
jgi:hypothetical protein